MKKKLFAFLPVLLLMVAVLTSCSEVEDQGKFFNWKERNEAFVDSLKALNPTIVATEEAALSMPVGTLFSIPVPLASTGDDKQYVYCKKIVANTQGQRPMYTESVEVYYYGTVITGDKFDGNFTGYTALDKSFPGDKNPTETDSPSQFAVTGVITGWTEVLQYMRKGERWMIYIPYQSAYGTTDHGSIPAYSLLAFDVQLTDIIK